MASEPRLEGTNMSDLPTPISTDGPPVDVPLLRKAVAWAEAEAAKPQADSEWNQASFAIHGETLGRSCGTAYCIAGYVAALDGIVNVDEETVTVGNTTTIIMKYAQEALGISVQEAWSFYRSDGGKGLFDSNNTITDVRAAAERIAARAGEQL